MHTNSGFLAKWRLLFEARFLQTSAISIKYVYYNTVYCFIIILSRIVDVHQVISKLRDKIVGRSTAISSVTHRLL